MVVSRFHVRFVDATLFSATLLTACAWLLAVALYARRL
jgi:hypothetical protein